MLTVHHLGRSQSERIVWLCEELGIAYDLKVYDRDPVTRLAPADYKKLHPLGAAPVITDGPVQMAESAAIMDYITHTYGQGRFAVAPGQPHYADYLYWFHFANGSLQPVAGRIMMMRRLYPPADNPIILASEARLNLALDMMDKRLADVPWLAGPDFTGADIMTVFTLTTMRMFGSFDIAPYANILAWLQRVGARPAYRRAMEKGDPGFTPMLTAANPG